MEILDSHIRSPPEKKWKVDDESEEDRVNGSSESKNSVITTESFESRGSAMSKGSYGSEESALLSAGDGQKVLPHHMTPPFIKEMVGVKVYYAGDDRESSDDDMGLGCFSDDADDKESSDEDMGLGYFSDNAYRRESKETDHGDEQKGDERKVLPHQRIPPFLKEMAGIRVYYAGDDRESSDDDMGLGCFSDDADDKESSDEDMGLGYFSDNAYRQESKETDHVDEQKGDEWEVLPHHGIPPFVKEKAGFKVYYSGEGEESSDAYLQEIKETDLQEIKESDNGDEHKVLPHHRISPFVEEKVGLKVCFGGKESTDEEDIRYSNEDAEKYLQQIKQTGGYEVDYLPGISQQGGIQPTQMPLQLWGVEFYTEIVEHAMREYDAKNSCECGGPIRSYITFQAKDGDDGDVKTYQTRVRIIRGGKVIEEVRLKLGEK
ncbi:uncharacterized protein LOC109829090 isoform X2 [Asparagus officinalis]|uniref:uncharacterized protein LOC109829090 isoform X2 n=1 Tax=Asparagus officinalis TaxID=4686 RepID=UPI00098E6F9F|nr:uncharacterized protein LOC109829090 isoform X2 [Asparagus officinalis]